MLFNSFIFIFVFLPIVFCGYYILNYFKKYKWSVYWLILGSLFFYGFFEPKYLILISISILTNFGIGTFINRTVNQSTKKSLLTLGLVFNISLLGYYKYTDFFITNINNAFGTQFDLLYLILPLGLSFITFQKIAYLVDVYKGEAKEYSLSTFALFATFFPQLIAGPIVHHKEVIPQFEDSKNKKINIDNISKGIFIFLIGLTKKVAIADTVAIWANDGFANYQNLTFVESWVTSLSYTTQLYFDFSGYCDMAIGLALLFNVKLPVNFFSPYKARNIQEFWKRWHMTLNRFLTQYVYFPLGGSRNGPVRTYFNIFVVFFISGFWHGAGWTFIIWGILHGLASICVRLWGKLNIRLPYLVSWFITFQFVNIAWVYFRATSVEQANSIIVKMFHLNQSELVDLFSFPLRNLVQSAAVKIHFVPFDFYATLNNPKIIVPSLVVLLILTFFFRNSIQLLESFKYNWFAIVYCQAMLLMVLISIYIMQKNSVFLYFNF
ncbi:MBOAT family O-acyltransferase [Robertmurraya kyonggiensis]|uniref:MBOAT family protein n=1 Tax=Robertmurraya kyonggiensis TaxID=1037680 RepID=A0A4U1D3U0_9BACI|nr:MBOAT family O-acyltransferase [Robertmurraya kyonggiensis]TKC17012.1 MBOAT family protein [Robertmurraya kyonggiensis]